MEPPTSKRVLDGRIDVAYNNGSFEAKYSLQDCSAVRFCGRGDSVRNACDDLFRGLEAYYYWICHEIGTRGISDRRTKRIDELSDLLGFTKVSTS